jgi:hypothetical protein
MKISFSAVKMTSMTDKMMKILNDNYEPKMGIPIQIANLGHSTSNFNFFVTQSVSQSITLS